VRLWVSTTHIPLARAPRSRSTAAPRRGADPYGRRRMVACVIEEGSSIEAIARRFQVGAKTLRKWRDRFSLQVPTDCGAVPAGHDGHRTRPAERCSDASLLRTRHRRGTARFLGSLLRPARTWRTSGVSPRSGARRPARASVHPRRRRAEPRSGLGRLGPDALLASLLNGPDCWSHGAGVAPRRRRPGVAPVDSPLTRTSVPATNVCR
jgi:hypothetical protein